MSEGNAAQIEFWNGAAGEKWAQNQDRMDASFAPLTAALLAGAAAAPGERVLDIGCGCGDVSIALAQAVGPTGHVTGIDVSAPMLAQARARIALQTLPLTWTLADAATHAFAPEAELIASRFGVMFFADPLAAFTNLRRALKPGGRLAMLCWRPMPQNTWFALPRAAVLPLVPPPEPTAPDAPGPFAFADAARVVAILERAGFAAPHAAPVDAELTLGEGPDALARATQSSIQIGPAGALLRDQPEATIAAARTAVAEALRPHLHDGAIRLAAACWLYTARA